MNEATLTTTAPAWEKFEFPLITTEPSMFQPMDNFLNDMLDVQPLSFKLAGMRNIKVKRLDLLKKIKANRDAHRDVFLKAQEGYRLEVIAELERRLKETRSGKKIERWMGLPEPQDHTDDYDTVIAMLEMSVDEFLEIDSGTFSMYVLDKWAWKQQADELNMTYATSAYLQ